MDGSIEHVRLCWIRNSVHTDGLILTSVSGGVDCVFMSDDFIRKKSEASSRQGLGVR